MRVKCVICDKIESIPGDSFQAKRLRNRPIHTFMCKQCEERIATRTKERIATGNFRLYKPKDEEDDW